MNKTGMEIMVEVNRKKIESTTEYLVLAYSPLKSEQAKKVLMSINHLDAAMYFFEGGDSEMLAESTRICDELKKYADTVYYCDILMQEDMSTEMHLLFANLAVVYGNARSLATRCSSCVYDDQDMNLFAEFIKVWARKVMDIVKCFFVYLGTNTSNDEKAKHFLSKVYSLNSSIIELFEMGF